MRILWVSHFLLYPENGFGALQRSRNLLLELCRRHEVHLVSLYRRVDTRFISDIGVAQQDLQQYCRTVELIPYGSSCWKKCMAGGKAFIASTPLSVSLYSSRALVARVLQLTRDYQIDLVHSDTLGLIDTILDRFPAAVKVLNHHNLESHMMFRRAETEHYRSKKFLFFKEASRLQTYENQVCRRYDMNLVVSDLDQDRLRHQNPEVRTSVIENSVDCRYYAYAPRDGAGQSLVFAGALDWYPNADAMRYFCQELWPSLKQRHSTLVMDVIGRNPPEDLRVLIAAQKDIRLHGYVSDVRPYVRRARVFVCPIRDGGGTRLKLLDALAQGIPVVATDIACEGLNLKHEEQVLLANTPDEFIRQIDRLLSDESLCHDLSVNGRKYVECTYSAVSVGEKLSTLYEHLVAEKRDQDLCVE